MSKANSINHWKESRSPLSDAVPGPSQDESGSGIVRNDEKWTSGESEITRYSASSSSLEMLGSASDPTSVTHDTAGRHPSDSGRLQSIHHQAHLLLRSKGKRRSATPACSNCRSAHASCSRDSPCTRCVRLGLECITVHNPDSSRRKKWNLAEVTVGSSVLRNRSSVEPVRSPSSPSTLLLTDVVGTTTPLAVQSSLDLPSIAPLILAGSDTTPHATTEAQSTRRRMSAVADQGRPFLRLDVNAVCTAANSKQTPQNPKPRQ